MKIRVIVRQETLSTTIIEARWNKCKKAAKRCSSYVLSWRAEISRRRGLGRELMIVFHTREWDLIIKHTGGEVSKCRRGTRPRRDREVTKRSTVARVKCPLAFTHNDTREWQEKINGPDGRTRNHYNLTKTKKKQQREGVQKK